MHMRLNLTSPYTENPVFRLDLGDLLPNVGPSVSLGGLGPEEIAAGLPPPTLRIAVYAQNAKGRSEVTILEDIALNDAEKRTGKFRNR